MLRLRVSWGLLYTERVTSVIYFKIILLQEITLIKLVIINITSTFSICIQTNLD